MPILNWIGRLTVFILNDEDYYMSRKQATAPKKKVTAELKEESKSDLPKLIKEVFNFKGLQALQDSYQKLQLHQKSGNCYLYWLLQAYKSRFH